MTVKSPVVRTTKTELVIRSATDDDDETRGSESTHKVGDRNCVACKDGAGRSRQDHCGRTLDLVIENGEKKKERLCEGRVHVTRYVHGDRAYWVEVISVCDACGDVKERGE